jgi:ADP-ribose pyrophosphatase
MTGLVRSRTVHHGRIVHLSIDTVRFPDGTEGEMEMIRHSGAAAVLPVLGEPGDPDPEIVLVRQYRYASGGYLLEVPAGRPDEPGESWETCARRELEEETGLTAATLKPLTAIHTTPGFTDETIHLFVATGLSEGTVFRDRDEFMEAERMRLSAALEKVRHGEITDAKTICTLLYAERFLLGSLDGAARP